VKIRSLLIAGGALAGALPAHAQSTLDGGVPRRNWTAEMSFGALVQPVSDGGTGGALAMSLSHRAHRATWAPTILLAAARVKDVGPSGNNRYIVDRDWGITALGADVHAAETERLLLTVGAKGGVLWSYDRQTGVRGTPLAPFGPTNWEAKAGLILDVGARYRVGSSVSIASRLGLVQHVFTDDLIGPSGALASAGVAFTW
jgi:hypothetical protein